MREGTRSRATSSPRRRSTPIAVRNCGPAAHVRTDEQIDAWIRKTAETIYHPVGSAKMGKDSESVVDAELKVYGVEGLRVVDASVMPTLVSGNTNAPTIMIAEKAADMILGPRPPLAPMPVHVAEDPRRRRGIIRAVVIVRNNAAMPARHAWRPCVRTNTTHFCPIFAKVAAGTLSARYSGSILRT